MSRRSSAPRHPLLAPLRTTALSLAATLAVIGCAGSPRTAARGASAISVERASSPTPSAATQAAGATQVVGSAQSTALRVIGDEGGRALPAASQDPTVHDQMERLFPKQYAASGGGPDPAANHWALLIGINAYAGSTEDSTGSRPDAQSLSSYLRSFGWRSDHILLLTDARATASRIVESVRWLASKTNNNSVVVFHFAGHERPASGDPDHDREKRDVALWATDNRIVVDGTLGKELNRVRAARMWLDFATCRASGFSDAGTIKAGRVLTYAAPESSFAYEDPRLKHTVMGWFLIVQALQKKQGDMNKNGTVTVEEAFSWSRSRIRSYTRNQQSPSMVDKLSGSFTFAIPKQAKASPSPTPTPAPPSCLVVC